MTKREQVAALRRIRKQVEKTHWVKGAWEKITRVAGGSDKRCGCLAGLINMECGIEPSVSSRDLLARSSAWPTTPGREKARELVQAVWTAIHVKNPYTKTESIESWNDRNLTKREDVIEVLDIAIENAGRAAA